MQKKLLTAAIGAALASPAFMAQADVTVYGIAQVEFATVNNDSTVAYFGTYSSSGGGGVGSWNNTNTIAANTTRSGLLDNKMGRFGVKADEDLGGGWKGLAQFEWQIDTADNQDEPAGTGANSTFTKTAAIAGTPFTDRKMFVGISHKSIGTLRFGQDDGPYKASGIALDPFVATTLEARNNYGMSGNRDAWGVANGHGGYWQDSLFFDSASWGGAYVNVALGLDRTGANGTCTSGYWGNCDTAGGSSNGKNNGDLNAVVGWKGNAGPVALNVFGGYMKLANTTSMGDPEAMKIGAQVTVAKAHTISMQWEQTDRGDFNGTGFDGFDEATYLFLGYQGKFGPVTAVAQFGMFEGGDFITGNYEATYMAVGAIYNMSKTFRIFAGWRKTEAEVSGLGGATKFRDDSVLTIGMRKDF
jgi:predicted porin